MRRLATAVMIIVSAIMAVSGCTNLLEGHTENISPHEPTPFERLPVEQITISDLDELRQLLHELIMTRTESTTAQYQGTDSGSVQEQALLISQEMLSGDPHTVYAVESISITATQIVAYAELTIEIEFKKTAEQIAGILPASNQRSMMITLLEIMSRYEEEAVFYTNLQPDEEELINQIAELYYQNPRRIVMMPFVTAEVYPDDENAAGQGDFRIYEIRFGYTEDPEMLSGVAVSLDSSVRQNAARARGDTDGDILLSLVGNLIASAQYDEGAAETVAMYRPQNIAATAFGALVRGSAVGEGFAMAFKALCDELRLDCRVVLGQIDGKLHAWNIVFLDGFYYHIDTAMCAVNGLEAGFLKTDEDFEELLYTWDTGVTPRCNGPLTLEDLLPSGDTDDPDDPDDPDGTEEGEDGIPDGNGSAGNGSTDNGGGEN